MHGKSGRWRDRPLDFAECARAFGNSVRSTLQHWKNLGAQTLKAQPRAKGTDALKGPLLAENSPIQGDPTWHRALMAAGDQAPEKCDAGLHKEPFCAEPG